MRISSIREKPSQVKSKPNRQERLGPTPHEQSLAVSEIYQYTVAIGSQGTSH
jgi:hypothetical protein